VFLFFLLSMMKKVSIKAVDWMQAEVTRRTTLFPKHKTVV
jgi:hypothetical protein